MESKDDDDDDDGVKFVEVDVESKFVVDIEERVLEMVDVEDTVVDNDMGESKDLLVVDKAVQDENLFLVRLNY